MSLRQPSLPAPNRRNAAFALAWLLALVLLVPVQLASIILFDSTGLDTVVPDLVFTAVVPAVVLAVFPTLLARRLYTRRTAQTTAVVALVAFTIVTAYTTGFYGMCGPGC